jgi:hypothetical protein
MARYGPVCYHADVCLRGRQADPLSPLLHDTTYGAQFAEVFSPVRPAAVSWESVGSQLGAS